MQYEHFESHSFIVECTYSEAAGILISTLDDEEVTVVNASSTVDFLCLAYGGMSIPSIEWLFITNGKTAAAATINNSTYNQRV